MKYCKRNREKNSNDAIPSSFYEKDVNTFCKEVGKRKPSNMIGVTEIDGLTNSDEIAMLFESKFKMVTGSTADGLTENNYNFCPNTSFSKRFNSNQIKLALIQLNDGIHSNHLKYTSPVISHILSRFINSCFIHNHFILLYVFSIIINNYTIEYIYIHFVKQMQNQFRAIHILLLSITFFYTIISVWRKVLV